MYTHMHIFKASWVIPVWPGLRTVGIQWRGRTGGKGQDWSQGNQGSIKGDMVPQARVVQVGLEKTRIN